MRFCGNCAEPLRVAAACPGCGFENPPGFKFCGECATPLESVPGADPPARDPRVYTPKHLADKILQTKSALEGERKHVTVLFADVKSSMEISESIDPEEWHRILDRFFQILADGVHRFEGTVNQYTGDGIMALFGAPIAHEDHAHRACYAVLHLRDELRKYADELRVERGYNFSVRMGLNSGEVIVGKIGDDLRMDYTAQGHTVNLAARMEQLAEAGKALLTGHTAELVSDYFTLRDLGTADVKGARDPLPMFELEGVGALRTRLDVSRARGFSRFVGRPDEMATLEAALGRAAEGNGQVVGVVADAGVGKSRLCFEFVEKARARGIDLYEAHCPAHGKTTPFLPVLELLRSYFGIADSDGAEEARRKIAGTLLLVGEGFREALPLVFEFLGVPDPEQPAPRMDPEARQKQLFRFVRELVQNPDRGQSFIIFVDDLHWVDAGSDAFVAQIVESVAGVRALVLVNFRPEYGAEWFRKSYYHQIPLMPLGPEAIDELLVDLLGTHESVAGLSSLIRDRTGGNPFFIEEVVQTLAESGSLEGMRGSYRLASRVESLEIPPTVQGVLVARIDRLGEREKHVLRTAAVIGKEFTEPILAHVAELPEPELASALDALKNADFVFEQSLYPVAEYTFKHPLTQDVALRSQLQDRRRRTHEAVARAIEELAGEKIEEQASLVAHHWDEAGEAREAALWHARAAEWIGINDFAQANAHWRRVRELLAGLPVDAEVRELGARACTKILNTGFRLVISDEAEMRQIYEEGLRYAGEDRRSAALVTVAYSGIQQNLGHLREYLELSRRAAALSEGIDDRGARAVVLVDLAWALNRAGHLTESFETTEEGLEVVGADLLLGADFGYSPYILFLMIKAWLLTWMGRLEEAKPVEALAMRLAREHGPLETLCWTLMGNVMGARLRGDPQGALVAGREAADVGERDGSPATRVVGYGLLGIAQVLNEDWNAAIESLERSISISRDSKLWNEVESETRLMIAHSYLGLGNVDRADEASSSAVSFAQEQGCTSLESLAHLARGQVLLAKGDLDDAERALLEAERLVGEMGALGWLPQIVRERARLAGIRGDHAERERLLQEAHRLFTEIGATPHAERVAQEFGS
jgi:class 3 adenylate cyclase/tetratricopeptide (TPR) repeat protein